MTKILSTQAVYIEGVLHLVRDLHNLPQVGANSLEVEVITSSDGMCLLIMDDKDNRSTDDDWSIEQRWCEEDQQIIAETSEEVSEPVVPTLQRNSRHKGPLPGCYLCDHEMCVCVCGGFCGHGLSLCQKRHKIACVIYGHVWHRRFCALRLNACRWVWKKSA